MKELIKGSNIIGRKKDKFSQITLEPLDKAR